jgi:hypothetical protein
MRWRFQPSCLYEDSADKYGKIKKMSGSLKRNLQTKTATSQKSPTRNSFVIKITIIELFYLKTKFTYDKCIQSRYVPHWYKTRR